MLELTAYSETKFEDIDYSFKSANIEHFILLTWSLLCKGKTVKIRNTDTGKETVFEKDGLYLGYDIYNEIVRWL